MKMFDALVNRRNSNSYKWDKMEEVYSIADASDILPMWVADMDFAAPKVVTDAIEKRLQHLVFGYSFVDDDCKMAISHWFDKRFQWQIDPKTILFHQGVVPAIASIIETFTSPGDKVAMSTPFYPPFFNVPASQGREVVTCDLVAKNGSYEYDFTALEETFKSGVRLYILCNPHNPAGVVWSRTHLEKLVQLCIQYDVYLLSDEIHADILFTTSYAPILTVANAEQAKIITCIAPTKTFNLAGIQAAMMVVPNFELRSQLEQNAQTHAQLGLNAFAITAVQAAYSQGEPWLDELLVYLKKNIDYAVEELNLIEGISVIAPDSTYLLWIDYRGTGLSEKEIMEKLLSRGKLALDPGTKFGQAGAGFLRMNIACPYATVQDGISRFKQALI